MNYTEDFLRHNIGKLIKAQRVKHKLTQECLADKLGIEPKTLSKVETGKVFVSASLLSKLANYFEMDAFEFFKFGSTIECQNDDEKIEAINQILKFLNPETLDIVYKMIKSLN